MNSSDSLRRDGSHERNPGGGPVNAAPSGEAEGENTPWGALVVVRARRNCQCHGRGFRTSSDAWGSPLWGWKRASRRGVGHVETEGTSSARRVSRGLGRGWGRRKERKGFSSRQRAKKVNLSSHVFWPKNLRKTPCIPEGEAPGDFFERGQGGMIGRRSVPNPQDRAENVFSSRGAGKKPCGGGTVMRLSANVWRRFFLAVLPLLGDFFAAAPCGSSGGGAPTRIAWPRQPQAQAPA